MGSCEKSNEFSGYIKSGIFLECMRRYLLLKAHSATQDYLFTMYILNLKTNKVGIY